MARVAGEAALRDLADVTFVQRGRRNFSVICWPRWQTQLRPYQRKIKKSFADFFEAFCAKHPLVSMTVSDAFPAA
jgi:hypothetical protein